jgi:hypothetical protein
MARGVERARIPLGLTVTQVPTEPPLSFAGSSLPGLVALSGRIVPSICITVPTTIRHLVASE